MRINHNIAALNTHRQLAFNNTNAGKSLEKLSSGFRINRAGDDAAGLAISEKMRAQIRGLDMASKNAQDGISLIQTAEGALTETHSILQRMRELAVQSSTDTNKDADRAEIQKEINQLAQEITRIANDTEFNQRTLLNGAIQDGNSGQLTFHIGANSGQNLLLGISALDAATLGVASAATETTGTGTDATNIRFGNTVGSAIVDGATITATYNHTPAGTTPAVAGEYSITLGTADIEIDGVTFTYNATPGANEWSDASELAALINADTTLSTRYNAVDNGGVLELTQLTGQESATAPVVTGGTLTTDTAGAPAGTTAEAFEVELSDGTTTRTITLSAAGEQTIVGTNEFAGLSFTFDTADGNASITVAQTTTAPSAATFNADGTLLEKAVAVNGIDVSTQTAADAAITTIQSAIETVSAERSKLGAVQNRLEHTINNLGASAENLTAAESRIRDVDMAKEMMEFTKNNILTQAAQAMLAQANQQPQGVLQLLR